jgi:uncharacterized protein YigA (DUF484 family)
MSNVNDQFDDEVVEQVDKNPVRARMRELESEVKALRDKAAEADRLQRELAFSKAGIPLDSPMSKYFVKAYDGEITAEAIRKAAEEVNLVQPQKPSLDDSEQRAWARLQKAGAGAQTSDPVVDWNAKINQARNQDEVMQILAQARQEIETI